MTREKLQNSLTVVANVKGNSNPRGRKSLKLEEELSFFCIDETQEYTLKV